MSSQNEKLEFIQKVMQKHADERRLGTVDLVKVILSVVSVLLTVIATLEAGNAQNFSFSANPCKFMLMLLPYLFLLLCSGFCVYHLNYSLNTYHTKLIGLLVIPTEKSESFDEAWKYLSENSVIDHPWLYQKSLVIIFLLFGLSLITILLRVF